MADGEKKTIHNQALKWISRYQGINKFQPGTKTGWFTAKNKKLNVLKIKTSRKRLIHNCWFCMLWINKPDIYPLVTIQKYAVSMEMYRVSAIVLLHNANFQAASHCCLYKFIPKHTHITTLPESVDLPKFSEQPLTSFSGIEFQKLSLKILRY